MAKKRTTRQNLARKNRMLAEAAGFDAGTIRAGDVSGYLTPQEKKLAALDAAGGNKTKTEPINRDIPFGKTSKQRAAIRKKAADKKKKAALAKEARLLKSKRKSGATRAASVTKSMPKILKGAKFE